MRSVLAMVFSIVLTLPALAGGLTEQHKTVIADYLTCGEMWGTVYGLRLPNESTADIAVGATENCISERQAAEQAIAETTDIDQRSETLQALKEKFHSLVVRSVLNSRMRQD